MSILLHACRDNNEVKALELIKLLKDVEAKSESVVRIFTKDNTDGLYYAIKHNLYCVAKELIANNYYADKKYNENSTSLIELLQKQKQYYKIFLCDECGCDVDLCTEIKCGKFVEQCCYCEELFDECKCFVDDKDYKTFIECCNMLINKINNETLNYTNSENETALSIALDNNHDDIIEAILKKDNKSTVHIEKHYPKLTLNTIYRKFKDNYVSSSDEENICGLCSTKNDDHYMFDSCKHIFKYCIKCVKKLKGKCPLCQTKSENAFKVYPQW